MPVKIIKPDQRRLVNVLVFGPSGHGKTHLLGTAQLDARTSPMLLLSFEGGEESLAGLDIDVVRIRDWVDYSEVYEYIISGAHPYMSIGLDSVTETHIFALFKLLDDEAKERSDPNLLQLQDYGRASVQVRRLIRAFRDLPYHTFYTGLSKIDTEPREGLVTKVNLAGSLPEEIAGMMTVTSYLALTTDSNGVTHRALLMQNQPKFRVKTRTPWEQTVPDIIFDPTVTKILDSLHIPYTPPPGDPSRLTESEEE